MCKYADVPKPTKPKPRKGDIDLSSLKPEDFTPVPTKRVGEGVAKLAQAPKEKKK
jgi:hypothetical protein